MNSEINKGGGRRKRKAGLPTVFSAPTIYKLASKVQIIDCSKPFEESSHHFWAQTVATWGYGLVRILR